MLKSMRSRMTIWFVLLLIPFLFGTSYFLLTITTKAAEDDASKALSVLKDKALKAMQSPDWKVKGLDQLADGRPFRDHQAGILVRDLDDSIVFKSAANTPRTDLAKQTQEVRDKWRASFGRFHQFRVVVLEPRKSVNGALPGTLAGLSIIILAAVAAGAWLLVGRVLSPIGSLARQTTQASADHMSVVLESPSKDVEMAELVETLNGLLHRVYETAEMKGRFYAAASHELRTPLQALSGHLELASSRKRTAEEYEEVVKESYKQTRRLISLVQGLLFLHQIDTRTHSSSSTVNLSEACESAAEMMLSLAATRNLTFTENVEPGLQVIAVPSHAEVLARNLIENAVKYTTEGGNLEMNLKTQDGNIVLEVINDFPESIKIATENVFEAFYRDDTSRNSKTGGNGLGLAISRAVSTANGWDVRLHQENGRVRAVVNFGPKEPPKDPKPKGKKPVSVSRTAPA